MVKVRKDLTGQRFGRLTVVCQADDYINPKGKRSARWLCKCDCGSNVIVQGAHLKSEHTQSCGCLSIERLKERSKKYSTYDLSSYYGIGYTNTGHVFYFDKEDYDKIKDISWAVDKDGYLIGRDCVKQKQVKMHQVILEPYDKHKYTPDHINRKPFDNRKCNLRLATALQQSLNKGVDIRNRLGEKGVKLDHNGYTAQITINGVSKRKYFATKEEAVAQRKQWEEEFWNG